MTSREASCSDENPTLGTVRRDDSLADSQRPVLAPVRALRRAPRPRGRARVDDRDACIAHRTEKSLRRGYGGGDPADIDPGAREHRSATRSRSAYRSRGARFA
jgi:hypothetical protein